MTLAAETEAAPRAGLGERLSDRLNPILVKEVRQALRGRYFGISFWSVLTGATLGGLAVMLTVLAGRTTGIGETVMGPWFFLAMFISLAVATQVLVPFSAFLSMGGEWDENTYDLLVLSNLKPRQIVLGKVLSAGVQSLLFYCAFGPFLVFAFLLRGVDLTAMFVVLAISLVGSVLLSCLSVAMSSFSRARFARVVLMVLLAVVLIQTCFGTIAGSFQLMMFPGELHAPEVLQAIFAGLSISLAVAAFFFAAACARLAHPEENRSTGLRIMTLVVVAIGLGWLTYILGRRPDDDAIMAGVCMAHAVLAAGTLFFATEPERMGRRVVAALPRNPLLAGLATPFLPGGVRGLVFYLLGSFLVALWAFLYPSLAAGKVPYNDGQVLIPFALTAYGLGIIGIPSAIFGFYSASMAVRIIARIATLVLFVAAIIVPALIGFFLGIEDWADFEHPFNVFLVIDEMWSGRRRIGGVMPVLIGTVVLCVLLNLPRFGKAAGELLRAQRAGAGKR